MNCRHCRDPLTLSLVDLGSAPPSNAYLSQEALLGPEKWFPLRVLVCQQCWLVQTEDFACASELFAPDYAYFSGFSSTWLSHCQRYVQEQIESLQLTQASHVVEVAANDGYLLQYFLPHKVPCTGIEPTVSTAAAARAKGIPIVEEFFGFRLAQKLAAQGKQADLMIANNVLAHVPDINDFIAGFHELLKPQGVATYEFPHLLKLIEQVQFDTIYHEHFSYLSLSAVRRIFESGGLDIFHVEELETHGGSLRVFAQRADRGGRQRRPSVAAMLNLEASCGLESADFFASFQAKTELVKYDLLKFLLEAKRHNQTVACYGAAAKGNTLLNYAGVRSDLIPFVADRNPAKQGKAMPGSRIPIVDESHLKRVKPDYVLILPWNLKSEIQLQLEYVRDWGAKFVTAVPEIWISE